DFVHPEDDLMDIADLNRLQVRAYFDEPEVGKLAKGQPVKLKWEAKPNLVWHGHVERPPTQIAVYNTRNVGECLITVDDARGELLPNTNVVVTVTTSQQDHVLSIPREALHPAMDGSSAYVYRIVDGKLSRTPVTLGTVVNLTSAQVVSGVKAGDSIVLGPVAGSQELSEGLAVKQVR
ncbi:MAG: efflux RND transporter periplasmic adaptor subunit, partial [Janthinobacterium lividum]